MQQDIWMMNSLLFLNDPLAAFDHVFRKAGDTDLLGPFAHRLAPHHPGRFVWWVCDVAEHALRVHWTGRDARPGSAIRVARRMVRGLATDRDVCAAAEAASSAALLAIMTADAAAIRSVRATEYAALTASATFRADWAVAAARAAATTGWALEAAEAAANEAFAGDDFSAVAHAARSAERASQLQQLRKVLGLRSIPTDDGPYSRPA